MDKTAAAANSNAPNGAKYLSGNFFKETMDAPRTDADTTDSAFNHICAENHSGRIPAPARYARHPATQSSSSVYVGLRAMLDYCDAAPIASAGKAFYDYMIRQIF